MMPLRRRLILLPDQTTANCLSRFGVGFVCGFPCIHVVFEINGFRFMIDFVVFSMGSADSNSDNLFKSTLCSYHIKN